MKNIKKSRPKHAKNRQDSVIAVYCLLTMYFCLQGCVNNTRLCEDRGEKSCGVFVDKELCTHILVSINTYFPWKPCEGHVSNYFNTYYYHIRTKCRGGQLVASCSRLGYGVSCDTSAVYCYWCKLWHRLIVIEEFWKKHRIKYAYIARI